MKIILKKPLWFTVLTTLCIVAVTLFATSCDKKIIPKHYIVSFVGEGVTIVSQSIVHGNHATAPENPEREGYSFGGWFTDNGTFTNEWEFKTYIVTQDTTLYAKWERNYPIDTPFMEYLLTGISCQWKPVPRSYPYMDSVFIINFTEDLEKFMECKGIIDYPVIDFSTHTLLFVYGKDANAWFLDKISHANCVNFQQVSEQSYRMKVGITKGSMGMDIYNWQASIIVNKLSEMCNVELIVTMNY